MIITIPYQRISLTHDQFILAGFGLLPFVQVLISALVGVIFIEGPSSGWHRYGGFFFCLKLALFQLPFSLALAYLFTARLKSNTLKAWEACEAGIWIVLASSLAATLLWWVAAILFNENASFVLLLRPGPWFPLPFFALFYFLNGGLSLLIGGYTSWYLSRHYPFSS